MDPDAQKMLQTASRYSYVGIFFGVAILIGYFAGRWLDGRFNCSPWFSMAGLIIGVAAGFVELIKLARRGLKDEQANGSDE
jgi:F0F1-type ATP synthase assembly protein I